MALGFELRASLLLGRGFYLLSQNRIFSFRPIDKEKKNWRSHLQSSLSQSTFPHSFLTSPGKLAVHFTCCLKFPITGFLSTLPFVFTQFVITYVFLVMNLTSAS
jgi:hypothetical protein